ncbi:MAG TPA: serine hydrolase, partial [Rhodanobacteraceae bacterium]
LADYARIGEFMLGGAKINGKRVVSTRWYRGAIRHEANIGKKHRGYGYLWWTSRDGSYAAYGIFGQMIYIDPRLRLVIAKVGAWPKATSKQLDAAQRKFVATIKRAVRAHPEGSRQK